jgi:TP901 family phage tail tape measure protein
MAASREVAELIITLEGQIAGLKKDLSKATGELDKFKKKNDSVFKGIKKNWLLYAGAITGTVLALRSIIKPFADLEHKMREVNTLANLGTKQLQRMTMVLVDMTRRVPQSAQELAEALYDIVSAGVEVGKLAEVLEKSAKAAVAGVTSTKTAARAGLAVINAYGKSIDDLGEVYDTLFQVVKQGVLTFEQLSGAIGTVLPVASVANVSISDIGASIAILTKQGIEANKATTFLRSGITALVAPTEDARKNMERMGITWKGWIPTLKQIHEKGLDLKQMRQLIPDIRAGQAIIALAENFEKLEESVDKMGESQGSMQRAFDIMAASPVNQMKFLANAVTEVKFAVAELIAPTIIEGMRLWVIGMRDIATSLGIGLSGQIKKARDEVKKFEKEELRLKTELKYFQDKEIDFIFTKKVQTGLIVDFTNKIWDAQLNQVKAQKELNELLGVQEERQANIIKDALGAPDKPTTPITDPKDTKKAKEQMESLRVYNALTKASLQELQRQYELNKLTISEYFGARKALAIEVYEKETKALADLLIRSDDENQKKKIRQEILAKEIELREELNQLIWGEAAAEKAVSESRQEVADLLDDIEDRVTLLDSADYQKEMAELTARQQVEKDLILNSKMEQYEKERALKKAQVLWDKEQSQLLVEYERKMQLERLNIAGMYASNAITIFDNLYKASGEKVKAFFVLSRLGAMAQATIDAAAAMVASYKYDPYGFLAGTIALATGTQLGIIAGTTIAELAEGGEVFGRSGRDKVPARLTAGEYVNKKGAVDHYGVGVFEALNQRRIPKGFLSGFGGLTPRMSSRFFAEGGLAVGRGEPEGTGLQINNIVDPDLFGSYLTGNEGQDMIINVISQNQYEIKRRLGI